MLKSAEVAGQKTRAVTDYAVPGLRNAAHTVIQSGHETVEGVNTIVRDMNSRMNRALGSATDGLGEAVANLRRRERNVGAQSPAQVAPETNPQDVVPGEHNV